MAGAAEGCPIVTGAASIDVVAGAGALAIDAGVDEAAGFVSTERGAASDEGTATRAGAAVDTAGCAGRIALASGAFDVAGPMGRAGPGDATVSDATPSGLGRGGSEDMMTGGAAAAKGIGVGMIG